MTSIPHPLSDCAFGGADGKESFKRPRSVYEDISDANSTLSNHNKWFIMSNGSSQYNPGNEYIISPSTFQLGQIFELREIIPLFFEKPQQSTHDASSSADNHLDSKVFTELQRITEFLERLCKDGYICTNIDPIEEAETEEQRKKYWWALPILPTQESYHFHVTPYQQRNYMSLSKFTVALAFILEGYDFEIEEGAFRLLTKQIEPSKQTVYYYQWRRTSLDDRFEEPIRPQSSAPFSQETDAPRLLGRYYSASLPVSFTSITSSVSLRLRDCPVQVETNPVQASLTRYKREEWWE